MIGEASGVASQGSARMAHDFQSADRSFDDRTGTRSGSAPRSIGFHELRQACEISALRESLERITQGSDGLRDSIETSVEEVRARFAALSPEELADSTKMAPLLEFAVATLLDLREQARALNTRTEPVPDADRPNWSLPDRPTLPPPSALSSPFRPSAPPVQAAPRETVPPPSLSTASKPVLLPSPQPPAAPAWLNSTKTPPDRGPVPRNAAGSSPKSVDWLGPARS
jgi:hypothetical protein